MRVSLVVVALVWWVGVARADEADAGVALPAPGTRVVSGVGQIGGVRGSSTDGRGAGLMAGGLGSRGGGPKSVVAKVLETTGGLTPSAANAALTVAAASLDACNRAARVTTPAFEGVLVLSIAADAEGRVGDITTVESRVPSPELEQCVRASVAAWRFPGGGGAPGGLRVRFDFGAGAATTGPGPASPGMPGPATRLVPGKTTAEGGLTADEVARIVRRHAAELRDCVEQEVRRTPTLAGKAVLAFRISTARRVEAPTLKESTLANAAVEQCILEAAKRWMFPEPRGGAPVAVEFPFLVQSAE